MTLRLIRELVLDPTRRTQNNNFTFLFVVSRTARQIISNYCRPCIVFETRVDACVFLSASSLMSWKEINILSPKFSNLWYKILGSLKFEITKKLVFFLNFWHKLLKSVDKKINRPIFRVFLNGHRSYSVDGIGMVGKHTKCNMPQYARLYTVYIALTVRTTNSET